MNREQRREFIKTANKNGIRKERATDMIHIAENGAGERSTPQELNPGDRVTINIDLVESRQNYDRMLDTYKSFVKDSGGKVFTVFSSEHNIIRLKEEPKWLFWSGDLKIVTEE